MRGAKYVHDDDASAAPVEPPVRALEPTMHGAEAPKPEDVGCRHESSRTSGAALPDRRGRAPRRRDDAHVALLPGGRPAAAVGRDAGRQPPLLRRRRRAAATHPRAPRRDGLRPRAHPPDPRIRGPARRAAGRGAARPVDDPPGGDGRRGDRAQPAHAGRGRGEAGRADRRARRAAREGGAVPRDRRRDRPRPRRSHRVTATRCGCRSPRIRRRRPRLR